jgi:hypothetical protein
MTTSKSAYVNEDTDQNAARRAEAGRSETIDPPSCASTTVCIAYSLEGNLLVLAPATAAAWDSDAYVRETLRADARILASAIFRPVEIVDRLKKPHRIFDRVA